MPALLIKAFSPMRMNHNTNTWIAVFLLVALLVSSQLTGSAFAARSREALPANIMEQWQRLKAEAADTGKVAGLMEEGERIILRLQELDDLRRDPQNPPGQGLNQRIDQLQDRFKDLLRKVELARVSHLPNSELEVLKARYEEERDRLQSETTALEDTIISRGEHFLATYKQNVNFSHYLSKQEMVVDFVYRLAEIYYQRGEGQFFTTNDISSFKPALEKYQRIIDEFPASEYVDDALYNIAYVKINSLKADDQQEAIKLYKTLMDKYAGSPFVPEAYWRVGEYYFYQDPPQIAEAIQYYSALENYPETHWYARGLYKVGWCHFRQADYPGAVDYFTRTVEASSDSAAAAQDLLHTAMLDEALQYISVCFAQDQTEWAGSGVANAVAFVQADTLRRNSYGKHILEYLGDIYKFQIGKFSEANQAYQAYLNLYPLSPESPWVREKVVNTYAVNLRDFQAAYQEKDSLYQLYRAGTEWALVNPDTALRVQADSIIEKYYYQNIGETIGRALDNKSQDQLQQSVQLSRNYLETFPAAPNAYVVNFNLAVLLENHLGDDEQAYAEFIRVSKDYPDSSHKKESAVNAAIIAQKMINLRGPIPLDSLLGTPLSDAETKYLAATENYLNLFPQGEEAELFLLNAGAINYNHGLYEDSRKYYNRLLADFPNGSRCGEASRYVMNGYFAEKNWIEAERVAKEIQAAGYDSSLVAAAKTKQAESVFLNAQGLKDSGLSAGVLTEGGATQGPNIESLLVAATEFKRAALESPDYAQADKALFEAGLTYQQAKSWSDANEVYRLLVERYPQSDLADKALYNIAYNSQSELGDKATAAATFERLAQNYPESPLAQDALRNASLNFSEAGDWAGAIRANNTYFQAYPTASDANLFLFENAGLFLKLGDQAAADQIYSDYSRRFPNDPRTVRAHWERGQYLQDKGQATDSYAEFSQGISAHRKLIASGTAGEETYASRCLLEVVRKNFTDYQTLQFAPASATETNKKTKLAKRDLLLKELEELNKMGKDECFEGLFTVGRVEEDLSQTFERQELPTRGAPEENILTREVANQDAIEIGGKAMAAFAKAAEDINVAAGVLRAEVTSLQTRHEALSQWVTNAQKADPQPRELPDSTAALADLDRGLRRSLTALKNAEDWSARALGKVPELALRNAGIKLSTVQAFLALPDVGRREELRIAYRYGVLSEFAAPRGVEVIRLYGAALSEAKTEEWQSKIQEGISLLFTSLPGEFRTLNERALGDYSQYFSEYQDLLTRGAGAVNANGLQAADVAERLVFYSTQSFEFAKGALEAQDALLKATETGSAIPPEKISRFVAAGIEEIFRINERYSALAGEATREKEAAATRANESVVWEDAAMTYEDCAFNFGEHGETLLAEALTFNQNHGNDATLALRLATGLAELNREKYLPLLAPYGVEAWLKTDETFKVNVGYIEGWESPDFDDGSWPMAAIVGTSEASSELAGAKALWISSTKADPAVMTAGASLEDTTGTAIPGDSLGRQSCPSDTMYLRKAFWLDLEPVAGEIWILSQSGYALSVNGDLVSAVEASVGTGDTARFEVGARLQKGCNVISILAIDTNPAKQGLTLALRYKVLPTPPFGGP